MGLRGRAAAVALAARARRRGGRLRRRAARVADHAAGGVDALEPVRIRRVAPLAYRNDGRVNGPYPIAVDDVSYAAPGGRVQAYLAAAEARARKLPAVIYLHGSGEGRERFLLPAVWAAGRRAVGMTLTLPSSSAGAAPAA